MCRCSGCYDCPSCQHTLSVRATNVTTTDAEGHATPRKAYYLACGFCRWTSRDIGLKDQFVGSHILHHVLSIVYELRLYGKIEMGMLLGIVIQMMHDVHCSMQMYILCSTVDQHNGKATVLIFLFLDSQSSI